MTGILEYQHNQRRYLLNDTNFTIAHRMIHRVSLSVLIPRKIRNGQHHTGASKLIIFLLPSEPYSSDIRQRRSPLRRHRNKYRVEHCHADPRWVRRTDPK